MAVTGAATELTARHREAQLQVRALALRDFTRLWPIWTGDRASFERLIGVTFPLVGGYHRLSSALAASYYDAFRRSLGVPGPSTPKLAAALPDQRIAVSLYVTGLVMTGKALAGGQTAQEAMQTALTRTSGAVGRLTLDGGRDTIVQSTAADPAAHGWERVTSGSPCDFCAELAGEGPVSSESGADFQAHDHCACTAEPAY